MQVLADPLAFLKRDLQIALSLTQRLFHALTFGDVGRHSENHRRPTIIVEHRPLDCLKPTGSPRRIGDHFFGEKEILERIQYLNILPTEKFHLFLIGIKVGIGLAN